MRRLPAILLGVALVSTGSRVPSLHTHVYTGHDHPQHHHGPAAHAHESVDPHPDDHMLRLESCDPGDHAVSIVFGCAALPHLSPIVAECRTPSATRPVVRLRPAIALAEVRVHGPPPRGNTSPRAPPLTFPA